MTRAQEIRQYLNDVLDQEEEARQVTAIQGPHKMGDTRAFPIQANGLVRGKGRPAQSAIPWWLAEVAYEHYAKRWGTDQSLERLAERGGFGRAELVALIRQEVGEEMDGDQ